MNFSNETQQATRLLLAMAQLSPEGVLNAGQLAEKAGLEQSQAGQVFDRCVGAGLIVKKRGMYCLGYHPNDITMGCIVKIMENEGLCCQCGGRGQGGAVSCPAVRIWRAAQIALEDALDSISLQDVMDL